MLPPYYSTVPTTTIPFTTLITYEVSGLMTGCNGLYFADEGRLIVKVVSVVKYSTDSKLVFVDPKAVIASELIGLEQV
jgi:hypothetical protein